MPAFKPDAGSCMRLGYINLVQNAANEFLAVLQVLTRELRHPSSPGRDQFC